MNNGNTEELAKTHLDKFSKITTETLVCFDALHQALDRICQAADGDERKADIRSFTSCLIQATAKQLFVFNTLIHKALITQLEAELSPSQLPFTFGYESADEDATWDEVAVGEKA